MRGFTTSITALNEVAPAPVRIWYAAKTTKRPVVAQRRSQTGLGMAFGKNRPRTSGKCVKPGAVSATANVVRQSNKRGCAELRSETVSPV